MAARALLLLFLPCLPSSPFHVFSQPSPWESCRRGMPSSSSTTPGVLNRTQYPTELKDGHRTLAELDAFFHPYESIRRECTIYLFPTTWRSPEIVARTDGSDTHLSPPSRFSALLSPLPRLPAVNARRFCSRLALFPPCPQRGCAKSFRGMTPYYTFFHYFTP